MADFDSIIAQYVNRHQEEAKTPAVMQRAAVAAGQREQAQVVDNPFELNPVDQQAYLAARDAQETPLQSKRASVAAAAEQKKVAMGGILPSFDQAYQTSVGGSTNKGANTMSEVEQDIRTLRPIQLRAKYGDRQAAALMGQANLANQAVLLDGSTTRSDGQVARDTAVDIASGFVMPALNIGAFGLGLLSDNAGVVASQGLEKLNNFVRNDLQSDELGQRRRLNEARNALDSRDSKAQQDIDLANGDSELLAGLKRFGRGAINSVSNATDDSAILGSGIANGVGSLLSGSVMAKGVSMAGKGALNALSRNGVIKSGGPINTGLTGKELGGLVDKAAFPATIGMMEASSVYQQTVADSYARLIADGVPHDEAVERATDAGMTAFAVAFPAAVGLSKLVQGFEQTPFARTSVRQSASNAIREFVEEGGQSGTGRGAQNFGTKLFVDPKQDLLDQVGEQTGEGALYGMGTSMAISAPSLATNSVADTSKYLWGKASGAMADAAAKLEAENEAASPLAPNKVAAEVAATQAAMPETAAAIQAGIDTSSLNQEEKAEGQAYAATLTNSLAYGEAESAHLANHPIGAVVAGSKDKAEAMLKLAKFVNENGDAEQGTAAFDAAQELNNYVLDLEEALRTEPASLSKLPADHPAIAQMKAIKDTLAKVNAQPVVKKALDKADAIAVAFNASNAAAQITAESLATPEGQQFAQTAANVIAHDPAKANPALVNAVLAHATSGKLVLTPKQKAGVEVAKTLFDAARSDYENRVRLGLKKQDEVKNQIQAGIAASKIPGQLSALEHATDIYNLYRSNQLADATDALNEFRKFAQGIHNKLAAFNQHLLTGKGDPKLAVEYDTIDPVTRKPTKGKSWVKPWNDASVALMQDVAADAQMLTEVYNNLRQTFPELQSQDLSEVTMDPRIDKPAVEVVVAFKTGTQSATTAAPKVEPENKASAAIEAAVSPATPAVTSPAAPVTPAEVSTPDSKAALTAMGANLRAQAEARKAAQEAKLEAEIAAAKVVSKNDGKVNTSVGPVQEAAKTEQVGEESSVDLATATPEQKKEVRQLLKLIRETNSAKKKAVRENPQSLWTTLKHSMNAEDLSNTFGPDWKKTRTLLKGNPGVALSTRVAEGHLDEFLPYDLRFGLVKQLDNGYQIPDERTAVEFIQQSLVAGDYLTEDTRLLLGQIGTSLQELEQALNAEDLQNALEQAEAELAKQKTNREARRLAKAAATASQTTTGSDPGTSVPQAPQGSVAPVVTPAGVVGINIYSKSADALGRALTNPTYDKYTLNSIPGLANVPTKFKDAERWYLANKATTGTAEEKLAADMQTMKAVIIAKLQKYPELVTQITERGGKDFLKASEHTVGIKGSRWEGVGSKSNFMKVLNAAYQDVLRGVSTVEPTTDTTASVSLVQMLDGIATGVSSTGPSKFVPNAEQAAGISKIRKFLDDRKGGNIFVLEGKAGTGKTSLIQEAVAPYLKDGGTVVVAAVSHKAKGVLEQKLANFIQSNKLRGKVKAHSVAGLLGMKRDETTGDFVEDPYAESSVDQVQVLVVDEASMVNAQNKRILESRLPANAKLIYLGDRNQIAPIEKKGSPNLGKISQVFTMDTGTNKHSLVTRVRQGEDSTILPYADHYWNNAENGNSVADPVPAADRVNSGELVMLPSLGWVDQVIPLFKKAFAAGNANLVKVMAFNNMENATSGAVMLRNAERKIREAMFGKDLLEYNKGELLIMTNSFGRGEEKLENSAELLALRSTPTTVDVQAADGSMVTLDAFQLTVEDTITGKTVTVPVVAESSKARHKAIYEGWGNLAKSGQRSAWKMFWKVKEQTFAPVAYSYILTAHKAQGSTYDVAVVLEDNIQTSPDTAANKSRIMYTAITRASKMAVMVSGKNTKQPLIAKPAVEPKKKTEPAATSAPAVAEPTTIAPAVVPSLVPPKVKLSGSTQYTPKDQAKSDQATKFIGQGVTGSSTAKYAKDWGDRANTGSYTKDDVVFISANGATSNRLKPDFKEIGLAVAAGSTLITDSIADRTRAYNVGEREIAEYLTKNGYAESSPGKWTPTVSSSLVQEEEADSIEEEDDSDVTPFVYTGEATGLRDVPEFSKLFGGTSNRFLDAYRKPAEDISRVSLADDALTTVAAAVSSDSKLQAMMEAAPKPGFSSLAARIYTQYVAKVGTATLKKLNENLQSWLAYAPEKGKNAGVSRLNQILTPGFINNWPNGKIVNLLQNDNGKLSYDSKLVEGAVLAGLQWLITSEGASNKLTDKNVSAIFGIDESEVPAGLANAMSIGQGELNAVGSLAKKIQEYWGLESNKDYPLNQVSGITGSVAAEILFAFESMGLLTKTPFTWEKAPTVVNGKTTRQIKTHNRVEVKLADSLGKPDNFKALQSYPDAIEQAVMVNPEQTVYLEGERPDVARTQMRNPGAKNKKQALKAIEVNQDTAYKFTHQYKLYEALAAKGFGNLMKLFGFGELTADAKANKFNKNHLVAVEGKNQSIVSAINGMDYLDAQVKARAEAVGKSPEEIEVHFPHAPSKVQRLQQIGRVTPQGDKNMRAALSPHQAVLDLDDTRRDDYKNFLIAIAQAVGIRIHNIKPEIVLPQIKKLLNNELKPAVDVLQDWAKNMDRPIQDDAADIFLQSFKDAKMDFSNLALQSLTEYALYLNAERGKGRNAFPVTLYGEADGMQNGPGGAMILHSTGAFTVHQLQMMRKVGYYPGQKGWTAQDQFVKDSVDTYGTVAQSTQTRINGLMDTYEAASDNNGPKNQVKHMLDLMELLFEGNLSFNDKNELVIKRGAAKSPVTVTIYGAGQQGIASKIAGIIVDELYEKMSAVAAAKYADRNADAAVVMFGSKEKFDQFTNSWDALTNWYVGFNKNDSKFYLGNTKDNIPRIESVDHQFAVNYTVEPEALQNLTSNVKKLFVEPMDGAIRETMGESLMSSMELIRQATQVQTIFLEDAFQTEVKRALDKKEKEDPNFQKGDFLSENELKKILDKLKYMMPKIDNGSQEYYLAGSSAAEVGDVKPFGMSLNEHFKTPAMVYGPKDLGVGGIAALNIGMVDGQMIMNFYWNGDVVGTMPVFDGINLPLDKLEEYSEKANKAIFDAWMDNAMKALSESYSVFMQDTDITAYLRSPQLKDKLAKAMLGQRATGEGVDADTLNGWLNSIQDNLRTSAVDVEIRHLAMQDIGAGIDQMAGFSSPHWHEGTISVDGMDLEQITGVLNERMEFHRERVTKQLNKTQDISEAVSNSGLHDLATGAKVFYQQNFSFLGSQMNIPQEQRWMYNELVNSKALEGWTFITGTNEQIRAEAEQLGVAAEHLNNLEKGLTLTADKIVMFPNATSETLVHEMIHAATFSTIYQHYSGELEGNVAASVAPVVERLKGLMDQFMALGEELPILSTETTQQYLHVRSVIQNHLNQGENALAKASALNEFMAYTQSNPAMIRMTKNTKVSALVRIAKEVLAAIKEMIWGKRAPKVSSDMFSNVRFNTALLARYQPSVGQTAAAANAALAHTAAAVGNPRLQELRDYFLKKIPNHLTTPVDRNNFGTAAANIHATSVAVQASITAAQHGFRMNHLEDSTFTSIVHALATQAAIDPNSMARAQELFTLATKKLEIKDFIDPTNTDAASALYYAKEQYELVMGEYQRGTDLLGRSTLLPVFLGLAMVNNHFRSVLSKLELPKSKLKEWNSADNAFENLGKMGLDSLSTRITGEGKHAPNVQAALDSLTNHLLDTAQDDLSLAEQTMGKIGTKAGAVNDFIVGNIKKVSDVTTKWAKGVIADSTQGKYKKALAHAAEITASIVNEDTANGVAETVTSLMNRLDGFRSLREMLSDIIGRTENTAELYDANKVVRSMVSQDRQHYRDGLPEIIRSKFSREVTDVELTAMFHGLGKTDIAALRETMKDAEIRELFTKASALPVAIRAVETQLKTADPKHWNQVEKKARQLAAFMNGKGAGTNLLRNAEAVSGLFMEKVDPKRTKPDDAFIKAVDKLITLYALDGMNEIHRNNLSSLVQSEADGVDFVIAYLTGQRAEEMRKAQASLTARENYFKSYIPSEQDGSVSLIVANDSEFSKLALKSFTKVESYKGSSLIGGEPKSYYFAKVPGRAPYNQGTMQNVRQTAGGIDLATGFTDGMMTAGRITDRRMVFKLAQNMASERATNEPLMPIYSNGVVVAFERAVDPLQLERLKQSTDLSKMIGVWRGRQVEEAKVQVFNEALVDAAKRLHKADVQAGRGAEYINVFDPKEQKKDPVLTDAVRLLNPETLAYLENVFGKDNFPVRKDMLNDMLGYRNATVGDMWTGNHRWSPETENAIKNMAISIYGNKAYQYFVNSEKLTQNVMNSVKTNIIIKSIVIPTANLIGNAYQLLSRGIPHLFIWRQLPRKAMEVHTYAKSRRREIEAEAELRAVGDAVATRRLTTEIQSIKDSRARMSIWPLIQAGQFSAISDMGISREDQNLTSGKLHDWIEGLVDKLPQSVRNAGRYAVISKDTALFRGLQMAVDYGDFIAKAVLYDHLTQQKEMTSAEALARISEEFVNYDKLPGRTRGYLENMGLLWFYNFKLRLVKVALSTIRNNPVHALLVGMAPKPTFFGSIGTPISDNFLTMGVNGELGNSIGLGMALNAPTLNPVVNILY